MFVFKVTIYKDYSIVNLSRHMTICKMCMLLCSLSAVPEDNGFKFFRLADLIINFQKIHTLSCI